MVSQTRYPVARRFNRCLLYLMETSKMLNAGHRHSTARKRGSPRIADHLYVQTSFHRSCGNGPQSEVKCLNRIAITDVK